MWWRATCLNLLKKLKKADAPVIEVTVDWRTRILSIVTNPTIAYLLILVGIYAIIFEFMNPGLVLREWWERSAC